MAPRTNATWAFTSLPLGHALAASQHVVPTFPRGPLARAEPGATRIGRSQWRASTQQEGPGRAEPVRASTAGLTGSHPAGGAGPSSGVRGPPTRASGRWGPTALGGGVHATVPECPSSNTSSARR
jgi:hypothetical protein